MGAGRGRTKEFARHNDAYTDPHDMAKEISVGRVGDSYDHALAESIIGVYKTKVLRTRGPWRGLEAVELATLEWVD